MELMQLDREYAIIVNNMLQQSKHKLNGCVTLIQLLS